MELVLAPIVAPGIASAIPGAEGNLMLYNDLNSYPDEIRPIIKTLLSHEDTLTWGDTFILDVDEPDEHEATIAMLSSMAYELLTDLRIALQYQMPLWEFKNGQFANKTVNP